MTDDLDPARAVIWACVLGFQCWVLAAIVICQIAQ